MRVVGIERIGASAALVERAPSIMARIVYRARNTTHIAALDRRSKWRWEHNDQLCDALTTAELERA